MASGARVELWRRAWAQTRVFIRKLLIPLTREGMIVAAIGKGGGLHLGRAAEQITLRDLYLAVMEDKRILVARGGYSDPMQESAAISTSFLQRVATDAETAMLDALGRRKHRRIVSLSFCVSMAYA